MLSVSTAVWHLSHLNLSFLRAQTRLLIGDISDNVLNSDLNVIATL